MKPLCIFPLIFFAFTTQAQDLERPRLIGLETNVLSWVAGHVGPEIRLSLSNKSDFTRYIIGFRYSPQIRFLHKLDYDDNDLTVYRTSLRNAYEFTAGFSFQNGISWLRIQPLLLVGFFNYDHPQKYCAESAPFEVVSETNPCLCLRVEDNTFTRNVFRLGFVTEMAVDLYRYHSISVGLTGAIGAAFLSYRVDGYKFHDFCDNSPPFVTAQNQTIQWSNKESFWLQRIPFTKDYYEQGTALAPILRLGLWVKYTLN